MRKKCIVLMVLAAILIGGAFAQTDFDAMPKNTIIVDFGPTIVGAGIGAIGNTIGEDGVSSSGFGIAAQYERQLLRKVSVGLRFAYLGGGLGFAEEQSGLKAGLNMKLSSFSLEGHVRFYPFAKTFFLDGMLGYAYMSAAFSGEVIGTSDYGVKVKEAVSFTASRNYFKLGAKLGWRIDFGKPGGFIFEPSLGYYGGIGIGDSLGKKLSAGVGEDISDFDEAFTILENFIFIGGPRLTLSFGWRF